MNCKEKGGSIMGVHGYGNNFALIVVLFILLIIIGCGCLC
ncbi:YjcZ family sporulation protein [Priestia megaterium]|nr:YjcZ family sporulation protein [Priestia megaterium]